MGLENSAKTLKHWKR